MRKKRGRAYRTREKKKTRECMSGNEIADLLEWMRKERVIMKKMKPDLFNNTGRGLKCYEVINSGDLVIAVPYRLLITYETARDSYLQEYINKYSQNLSVMEIISIFLMCEKIQGLSSSWYLYIRSLPSENVIPLCFPSECLKFIPSFICDDIKKQMMLVHGTYNKLKKILEHIGNDLKQFRGLLTFELFQWAWIAVNTRAVYMESQSQRINNDNHENHIALAPFLDFLNHSPDAQVKAGFNNETNCYEIIHLKKIKKYQQIFINYGSHTNRTLFLEYGFIIPNNPHDTVIFDWDEIEENLLRSFHSSFEDIHFQEKISFLQHYQLLKNLACDREGLTWNFEMALRILSARNYERDYLERVLFSNAVTPEEDTRFIDIARRLFEMKLRKYSAFPVDGKLIDFTSCCIKLVNQLCYEGKSILLSNLTQLFISNTLK